MILIIKNIIKHYIIFKNIVNTTNCEIVDNVYLSFNYNDTLYTVDLRVKIADNTYQGVYYSPPLTLTTSDPSGEINGTLSIGSETINIVSEKLSDVVQSSSVGRYYTFSVANSFNPVSKKFTIKKSGAGGGLVGDASWEFWSFVNNGWGQRFCNSHIIKSDFLFENNLASQFLIKIIAKIIIFLIKTFNNLADITECHPSTEVSKQKNLNFKEPAMLTIN